MPLIRRTVQTLLPALAMLAFGCSSANAPANLIEPEFRIMQMGGTAHVARHVTGPITVNYHAEVLNRSSETLTLKRIQVESMGDGAYAVRTSSHPFDVRIGPNQIAAVEFWVAAFVGEATIVGANGPVTLRTKVEFDSPEGMFQKIYVSQVNAGSPRPFSQ